MLFIETIKHTFDVHHIAETLCHLCKLKSQHTLNGLNLLNTRGTDENKTVIMMNAVAVLVETFTCYFLSFGANQRLIMK